MHAQHQFQCSQEILPTIWDILDEKLDEGSRCLKQWVEQQPLPLLCFVDSHKITVQTLENQTLNVINISAPNLHFIFCPDIISFLIYNGNTLQIWSLYDKKAIWTCSNVPPITYMFVRNMWAALITYDNAVYWLNLGTYTLVEADIPFRNCVAIAIHPIKPICVCNDNEYTLYVCQMQTGKSISSQKSTHSNQITRLQWNNEGTYLFSSSLDHRILIWNFNPTLNKFSLTQELFTPYYWTRSLVVLPKQNFLAINEDGTIHHYHYESNERKWEFNQAFGNCDFCIPKIKIIPPNNLLILYRNEWIYCSNDLKYIFQQGKTDKSIHSACFL